MSGYGGGGGSGRYRDGGGPGGAVGDRGGSRGGVGGGQRGGFRDGSGGGRGGYGGGGGVGGYGGGGGGGGYGGGGGHDRGGSRGGGSGDRSGDWTCLNAGCGNVNFARRMECNKCQASKPQSAAGGGGGGYGGREGGGNSYDEGGQGGYGGRGHDREQGRAYESRGGGYGAQPREDITVDGSKDVPVKQCDENCGDSCDNARIYISGLPLDVKEDELQELFGGIGQVARVKQKRGYKDQWPYNIKIYQDESGKNKGDAVLSYEDPHAAHSAGGFFNDYEMRGHKIKVAMAAKSAPKPPPPAGGGYRGGQRGGGGPDRRDGGGYRSRPY